MSTFTVHFYHKLYWILSCSRKKMDPDNLLKATNLMKFIKTRTNLKMEELKDYTSLILYACSIFKCSDETDEYYIDVVESKFKNPTSSIIDGVD